MKHKALKFIFIFVISVITLLIVAYFVLFFRKSDEQKVGQEIIDQQSIEIEDIIKSRQAEETAIDNKVDPFGEDGLVRVLLIGLDSRAGQTAGHCDVIQMIEIDKNKSNIQVTAVPRGTYSPLPPGKASTSTDYYVSNACGLAGLEYGIDKIEKILGKKADYLVMVGFSETLGILRNLKLPTTETLQWLRQRQGYAIGEPQRARNHSTFIKQLMTKYLPEKESKLDLPFHYILYKLVKTDLSFSQSEKIVEVLINMDLKNNSEKITLAMRPSYNVQDIPYDPATAGEYVQKMIGPIKNYLSGTSYTGIDTVEADQRIVDKIDEQSNDAEFIKWAFDNQLWLQIEDDTMREENHYEIMTNYISRLTVKDDKEQVVSDYILEMKYLGLDNWANKGEELLKIEIANPDLVGTRGFNF